MYQIKPLANGNVVLPPAVEQEFRTHEEWKKETKLMATPTILINGYELPDVYKIEDLIFFKDLRIEM